MFGQTHMLVLQAKIKFVFKKNKNSCCGFKLYCCTIRGRELADSSQTTQTVSFSLNHNKQTHSSFFKYPTSACLASLQVTSQALSLTQILKATQLSSLWITDLTQSQKPIFSMISAQPLINQSKRYVPAHCRGH